MSFDALLVSAVLSGLVFIGSFDLMKASRGGLVMAGAQLALMSCGVCLASIACLFA